MALLHRATIAPTKLELVASLLASRPWYDGPAGPAPEQVGAFRWDDPADEVGIETLLVRVAGGPVLQVPLTYRAAPLEGAEELLVGTMEHSVLGRRWIYDGVGDPAYVSALAAAVLARLEQAELVIEVDGRQERREQTVLVTGGGSPGAAAPAPRTVGELVVTADGDPAVIRSGGVELRVPRVLGRPVDLGENLLTGTWAGQEEPVLLAGARPV